MKTELNTAIDNAMNAINEYNQIKEKQKRTRERAETFFNFATDTANIAVFMKMSDRMMLRSVILKAIISGIDMAAMDNGFRDELKRMREYSS